jgi:hypothetical protein
MVAGPLAIVKLFNLIPQVTLEWETFYLGSISQSELHLIPIVTLEWETFYLGSISQSELHTDRLS